MADSRGTNDMSNQSNCSESYGEYLKRAAGACEAGDLVLGMHLYLAAYELAVADPDIPDGMAIAGLREAWNLACDLKERSMAEYVFEKLEPFLTGEEIAHCANMLQNLALDRLEEYGFSREELQDMAEMISQDFMDGEGSIVKVESISLPGVTASLVADVVQSDESEELLDDEVPLDDGYAEADGSELSELLARASAPADGQDEAEIEPRPKGKPEQVGVGAAAVDFNPYDWYETSSVGTSYHAATNEGAGSYVFTRDNDRAAASERARTAMVRDEAEGPSSNNGGVTAAGDAPDEHAQPQASVGVPDQTNAPDQGARDGNGAETDVASTPRDAAGTRAAVGDSAPEGEPSRPEGQANAAISAASGSSAKKAKAKAEKADLPAMPQVPSPGAPAFSYSALAGYGGAVASVRELGVGMERDSGFRNFIEMMNSRHGLDRMPALDTLLFRAPVIEDATRFVDATIGEIGLPVLRMSMEEGFQGAPMLCVTTFGDSRPRMNHAHNRFDGPAILVLDDLNTWMMPQAPENVEGIAGFVMANMSRGAREAINMIRSAVEDPDVYVLATASCDSDVDPFFYEILEPISIIDIADPTESERDEIWREIMHDHPSMRLLDRTKLVRFSAGMPRYDLYMAARAAIEEAYKTGLVQRMYLPVSLQNILDKLAACQPLDSDEYRAIEDEVVSSFHDEISDLENLLDGTVE